MQNYMAMFPGMGQQQQAAGMAQGIMQAVGVNQPMQAAMMGQQMPTAGMNMPMQGLGMQTAVMNQQMQAAMMGQQMPAAGMNQLMQGAGMGQQMPAEMMGMQGAQGRSRGIYDTSEDAELATSLTYVGRAMFASGKQEK